MAEINLKGIFPPIPTPFINGKIAHDKLEANIEKWSLTGINGLVVLGSNGESVYLSEKEKRAVVETAARSSTDEMYIIAGTGCESTEETLILTRDCAERGAHAALVITPHFFGGKMSTGQILLKRSVGKCVDTRFTLDEQPGPFLDGSHHVGSPIPAVFRM